MPYGLPATLMLTRSEWALDYVTQDPIHLDAGIMINPKLPLTGPEGCNGEWLCETATGRRISIIGHKLKFHVPSWSE